MHAGPRFFVSEPARPRQDCHIHQEVKCSLLRLPVFGKANLNEKLRKP